MTTVSVHEAKTHLSRLLQRVADGEEVLIANRGTVVARLSQPRRAPENAVPLSVSTCAGSP